VVHINQKNKFNRLIEKEYLVKKDNNMIKWASKNKKLLIRFWAKAKIFHRAIYLKFLKILFFQKIKRKIFKKLIKNIDC
jgi:hypothetical protein